MSKQFIGIDIGENAVKMAVCSYGQVHRMAVRELPENMMTGGRMLSPASMSEFLRQMKRENHISGRHAALILPEQAVFCRPLTMPAMTAEQLDINLPYEFRDYIAREKDKYFYDYAVVGQIDGEDGAPAQLELTAAAVLKETIEEYRDMLRRAGFRLAIALPQEMAWSNLLYGYKLTHPRADGEPEREFCLLDIGHTATRMFLYHGRRIEMIKMIDHSCSLLDLAIAESCDVDVHVAHTYKESNYENALSLEACEAVYGAIALEVMKALNFHAYEHRDHHLQQVYYCGGGASIAPLVEAIGASIDLPLVSMAELLPPIEADESLALACAAAIGATQQEGGR